MFCVHFRSNSLKIDFKEKKQQFWNLLYVILLFIFSCYNSFVSMTTHGKSLIKTKLNRLINRVCFWVWSVTKKEKHGNYSVKIHSEMYITWCMKVHTEEKNTLYMIVNWKIQCKFADAIIILRDDIRPDSHVIAIYTSLQFQDDIYFLPYCFTNINFRH